MRGPAGSHERDVGTCFLWVFDAEAAASYLILSWEFLGNARLTPSKESRMLFLIRLAFLLSIYLPALLWRLLSLDAFNPSPTKLPCSLTQQPGASSTQGPSNFSLFLFSWFALVALGLLFLSCSSIPAGRSLLGLRWPVARSSPSALESASLAQERKDRLVGCYRKGH